MITLINKKSCDLKLGKYLIKAGSTLELAEEEGNRLIKLYPNFLERKSTLKNKKKKNASS